MDRPHGISRKDLLRNALLAAGTAALAPAIRAEQATAPTQAPSADLTIEDLRAAERLFGVEFSDAERRRLLGDLRRLRRGYQAVRKEPIEFRTEPLTHFVPLGGGHRAGSRIQATARRTRVADLKRLSDEDIAYLSVTELAPLIRSRALSPVRLTEICLHRLREYGPKLLCVVSLLEQKALREAREAEREIAAGRYRGPLHGIPYGLKDLFATTGDLTTWGAEPYREQRFDFDAAVVERLRAAGAILVAKTSLGALAQGDVWFAGTTKNPWNPAQGSSGSSAGSAAAVAAGLVPFAIGTETSGSILSPSQRCRVTGLRPTFGRVSRYGGMAVSYTMDRVGPIARSAEDCALVLGAIAGSDSRDPSAVDQPFRWPTRVDLKKVRVGWLVNEKGQGLPKDDAFLDRLRRLGIDVVPVAMTPAPEGLYTLLTVEAASAFDAFTRGEAIQSLKNSAWPDAFRSHRFVPAVEYLQAQRLRTLVARRFEEELGDFACVVASGIGLPIFPVATMTGHPVVSLPNGADEKGNSLSRVVIGRIYDEARLLEIARRIQETADFHRRRPDLTKLEASKA